MIRGTVFAALVVCALGATAFADNKQLAKEAYTEGKRHYDLGEYDDALAAFKKAYLNYEEPVFLFNIAQCYRQIGDRPAAVRTYRAFLRNWPKAPNRDTVERIVSELETAIALDVSNKAAPPQDTLPPPGTAPPPRPQVATATQPKPTTTTTTPPPVTTAPATSTSEPKPRASTTTPAEPRTAPEPAQVATKAKPRPPSKVETTEMVEVEPNFDRPSGQSKPLKWWAWTLIAVGVGGVVAAAVVIALTQSGGNFNPSLPDFTVTSQGVTTAAPHLVEVRF